jgi:UDP-N-acetyl-2-amino-2-deoxyglucuronate dehydrogenase
MSPDPRNFALVGAAGYIAPRHLQAIHDTGQRLIAALDPSDSAGVLDRWFPHARFFVEFERFDRHAEKLRRLGEEQRIHVVSICSPNYLHDAHIRFALRIHADALCEKPLVLNPWNLDALSELEAEYGRRVWTVLQLRLHPAVRALRERVAAEPAGRVHDVDLTYITSRGPWYFVSWKGDESKSGGVGTNIGIHFFDMLAWVFGAPRGHRVHVARPDKMAGLLELERARVRWFLSLDRGDLPRAAVTAGKPTFRSLTMDGEEVEFSEGFTDLHTACYRELLAGRGFGLADARPSIELAHAIRTAAPAGLTGEHHPLAAGA